MQSFLDAWLAAAPKLFERELSGKLQLLPSARLPQPGAASALAITLGGTLPGRFLVAVEDAALHALFVEARLTDSSEDQARDAGLWRGLVQQVAAAAAQALDSARPGGAPVPVSIEAVAWTLGTPSAAYEMRFGDAVLPLAFADGIHVSESTVRDAKAISGAVSSPVSSLEAEPGGMDLLLDVELETSLRFGSHEMPLSEVLELGAGDVVELDRYISDPVDLLVGDKIVAKGEVVLVNGSFGLRVLEVAEPRKCLESIRCLF